ncbi:MAG: drug/metabolite transporter (DMT)-like permease [Parasphingorhabdus sp.]
MAKALQTKNTLDSSRPWWLMAAPVMFLFLWSGGYVVAKVGLMHSPPMTLLVLRYLCVVVLMAVLFVGIRPQFPATRQEWMHLVIVGLFMQVMYFGMCYLAFMNGIGAGTAALIMSLQPILVAIIAPSWNSEHVSFRQWGGLLIALAGTAMVIFARSEIGAAPMFGLLCAFVALAGISLATLWEKRFGVTHHPVTANLIGYTAGLVGVVPLMFWLETPYVDWTWGFAAALGYLVIGNSLVAVWLLLAMIRAGEVSKVSALLFLVPPLAALLAWFVLGEVMPAFAWLGLLISGAGVFLATRKW